MGSLAHLNLRGIRDTYGLKSFVETGTGDGHSVALAIAGGFEAVHSIEIVPELAHAASVKFARYPQVRIHAGASSLLLPGIIDELPEGPALFWLDAHFPGADYGMGEYDGEKDVDRRLPLQTEVELIATLRKGCRDLLIIDDARIYQSGPYGAGDLPADWPPLVGLKDRSLDFVRRAFGETHGIVVDYRDQGYVMVAPHVNASRL